ncbi:hypothetical protein GCK72_001444 [Caenorhabditis remanei]|uniref:tRNA (34-2'-O)-methyltransferase regulator WDR6 n=1 Tax=Caenorhabditis remanei TaxID=31234 RepID=A0A6A5HTF0_CAERE|nr:hypothetical protein GCK72_001444 [Caenorhabditis remanei]KAF1769627.1 hypothetical protein GCK72_001444 [Caenorhabditis remanei]
MEHLGEYPLLLDHIIQSEISAELLLDDKVITCAKFDQKYAERVDNRLEEEFPEHIIGCKELDEDDKIVTVTSRNTLTIRKCSDLDIESTIQCDYFATSICSLIHGDSVASCHVFFGSVIGDLIDWKPNKDKKLVMRKGHKGMIFSIVTDETRIFTISDDRTVRMWLISDREGGPICTVFGHTARPFAISIDTVHFTIYTGGIEQTLFCWKYDNDSIKLFQKIPLSFGVIRKITKIDNNLLAISSQNGDLLKIRINENPYVLEILKEDVVNFAYLKDRLVILTSKNELFVYDSGLMDRIVFRSKEMKHMASSEESVVAWKDKIMILISEGSVTRLTLSMNIISISVYMNYVTIKTIDGYIQVYDFYDPEHLRCLNRFRLKNAAMIPSVTSVAHRTLIIGTTHGEIYHSDLRNDTDKVLLSLTRQDSYEIFGGKEVTCIHPIPKTTMFMTLGKTGIWSTMRVTPEDTVKVMNSRSFSAASRVAWPSKFIEWNNGQELLIAGFYGTSLVIWNSTTGLPVSEIYCGGGHRIWQLNPSSSDEHSFNFDYIRETEYCRQKIDFTEKVSLISTAHSSTIFAASGSENYLVTVSLDGHLSIGTNKGNPILTMFVGENLLSTDVYENHGEKQSEVFVLTGGGKSKFSVFRFQPDDLKKYNVFWLRSVARPDEGRIVAVKTCRLQNQNYFIASYSSGVIEIFKISKDDNNLESTSRIEIEDSLGIGAKMDYCEKDGKLFVGTSGSYVLAYILKENGRLEEENKLKLSDRSGVTSIAISPDGSAHFVGCDSGHVYQCHATETTKIHSHLSTVVGIVVDKNDLVHSTSLDCVVLTSYEPSEFHLRKPTIIDMPNGMVRTGESTIIVVGDGIQIMKKF